MQHSRTAPATRQGGDPPNGDLAVYAACLLDPADIIEIRRLPSRRSTWHRASELPGRAASLTADNQTQNVFVGVNPRTHDGGTSAEDVALARCVFVDIDNAAVDEVRLMLRDSGLPGPTMIIASGRVTGTHLYWRLDEPLTDLARWTRIQKGLIAKLGGDEVVHDPPRIMRAPGFRNLKHEGHPLCRIVEAHPERTYPVDEFPELAETVSTQPPQMVANTIPVGERNGTLFKLAASLRAKNLAPEAILSALLAENQVKCTPPLTAEEVRQIAKSVQRYEPGQPHTDAPEPPAPWEPFPVDLLVSPLAELTVEYAGALGCDEAMIGMPLLAETGGCIGLTRRIQLKATWAEYPIIWAAIVADSGTLKSPSQDTVLRPLHAEQDKRFREFAEAMKAFEVEWLRYQKALRAWQGKTGKKDDGSEPPEKPERPVCTRYVVSDLTVEALAPILAENPRGLLLARDEIGGWLLSFNAYKQRGGDLQSWLELHRGGPLLVDRKTGRQTIYVPHAAVSICGGIQPGVLRSVLTPEFFTSGLAARLLFCMPPRRDKRWSERVPPERLRNAHANLIEQLLGLQFETDPNGDPAPVPVRMSDDAHAVWVRWYNEFAEGQREAQGYLASSLSKIEACGARLSLLFHIVTAIHRELPPDTPIDAESVRRGTAMADWLAGEQERVYATLQLEAEDDNTPTVRVLRFIERHGGRVSPRDVSHGLREFRGRGDAAEEILNTLVRAKVGQWVDVPTTNKGGRPTRVFELSPNVPGTITPTIPEKSEGFGDGDASSTGTVLAAPAADADAPDLVFDSETGEIVGTVRDL